MIEDPSVPNLLAQIVEDWKAHGRDWTRPGFQAVALHRFGNWRMRIRRRPVRLPLSFLYRVLFTGVRNVYGIELPYTAAEQAWGYLTYGTLVTVLS